MGVINRGPFQRLSITGNLSARNPLTVPNGIVYLNTVPTFATGFAHGTQIGQPGVTPWTNLFGQTPSRDGTQVAGGLRPLLQVTSNQSPSGRPLVRFDGVDDSIASVNPSPLPSKTLGYTWYAFGRLRSDASCCMIWNDEATGLCQVGFQGNPLGQPPFIRSEIVAQSLHTVTIVPFYGLFACVWSPGSPGTAQGYWMQRTGGSVVLNTMALTATWDLTENVRTGWHCAANCPPNMDLGGWVWYSGAHAPSLIAGIGRYFGQLFGWE